MNFAVDSQTLQVAILAVCATLLVVKGGSVVLKSSGIQVLVKRNQSHVEDEIRKRNIRSDVDSRG